MLMVFIIFHLNKINIILKFQVKVIIQLNQHLQFVFFLNFFNKFLDK